MNKSVLSIALILAAAGVLFASGKSDKAAGNVVLSLGNWDQNTFEYITNVNPIADAYRKVKPNVSIEIQNFPNSEQYEDNMKVRLAADELPDVFPLKPYLLVNFADSVVDLSGSDAAKNNAFAGNLAIDGKVTGIPLVTFYEFVYYHKSVFAKLGLAVPQTWGEFIAVLKTIDSKTNLIPLAIGLKDAWPNYPFNEYMPLLEAGNGAYYNEMAKDPSPFSPGKPFYKAYKKIDQLYAAGVLGDDPLAIGFDQTRSLFATGAAAVMAAGQWYQPTYLTDGGDPDDLGVFFLPSRDSVSEKQTVTTMTDIFYAVAKTSKHPQESLEFLNWFFSSYYVDFIAWLKQGPTVKGMNAADPYLAMAFANVKGQYVQTVIPPDSSALAKAKNATQMDVKRMGQEMYAFNLDKKNYFDGYMSGWNDRWAKALK